MQFKETYAPEEASAQVDKPMEQINYNQVLPQNCLPFPNSPTTWDTLLQGESVDEFQQETGQTLNNLHSKGPHQSSGMSFSNRRERNRERERKRQTRLKEAFKVLRSVIPDFFSEREPGDRLSKIQTLTLAKKYIATLHELLETC